jgi:putative toxin-antitoxin system antitoxin component (TIGR02293 family)
MTPSESGSSSDRAQRATRVRALALYVWQDNVEDATAFLSTPHRMLHGKTPLACAGSEADTALAEAVLMRLLHGVDG